MTLTLQAAPTNKWVRRWQNLQGASTSLTINELASTDEGAVLLTQAARRVGRSGGDPGVELDDVVQDMLLTVLSRNIKDRSLTSLGELDGLFAAVKRESRRNVSEFGPDEDRIRTTIAQTTALSEKELGRQLTAAERTEMRKLALSGRYTGSTVELLSKVPFEDGFDFKQRTDNVPDTETPESEPLSFNERRTKLARDYMDKANSQSPSKSRGNVRGRGGVVVAAAANVCRVDVPPVIAKYTRGSNIPSRARVKQAGVGRVCEAYLNGDEQTVFADICRPFVAPGRSLSVSAKRDIAYMFATMAGREGGEASALAVYMDAASVSTIPQVHVR
jgi:hypothetical protein